MTQLADFLHRERGADGRLVGQAADRHRVRAARPARRGHPERLPREHPVKSLVPTSRLLQQRLDLHWLARVHPCPRGPIGARRAHVVSRGAARDLLE